MGQKSEQIHLRITEQERDMIRSRMTEIGATNMSAYIRKMAIDGRVLVVDMPKELRDSVTLLGKCSSLLNQIALRANENNRVYETDLMDIQEQQAKMWDAVNSILEKFSAIG